MCAESDTPGILFEAVQLRRLEHFTPPHVVVFEGV